MESIPFSLVGRHRRFSGTCFLLIDSKKMDVLQWGRRFSRNLYSCQNTGVLISS